MRPHGPGILPQSRILLFDAAEQVRRMYFYALCVGHYHCSVDYVVKRPRYDSFLLLYVKRGRMYFNDDDGQRIELAADSFALIDCCRPHEYGAVEPCEFYWMHFDGPTARAICDTILAEGRPIPRNHDLCRRTLIEFCDRPETGNAPEDADINRMIVNLLTEFLTHASRSRVSGQNAIEEIRNYILENPDKDLTLEVLARRANLSPYHFARTFRQQIGASPHDYLIYARLNLAKFYLLTSDNTVKEIAFSCGFSSECSFCTTFKRRLGMTPTGFRASQAV